MPTIHFVSLFIAVRTSAEAPVRSQDVPRPRQASSDLDCRTSSSQFSRSRWKHDDGQAGRRWAARTRTPGSARRLTPVTAAGSGVSPPAPPARTGRCVPPHPSPEASAYSASAPPGRHPGRAARCRPRQARSRVRHSPGLGVKASAVRLRVTIVVADLGLLVQVHGVPEGGVTPDLRLLFELAGGVSEIDLANSWSDSGSLLARDRRCRSPTCTIRPAASPFRWGSTTWAGCRRSPRSASFPDDGQQGRRQSAAAAGSSHVGRAYCTSSGGGGRGIPESLSVDLPHGEQREAHDRRRAGDRRRRQARGLARRRE